MVPPAGTFIWQRGYPADLRAQWVANGPNPLVRGAIMAFKAQHHMAVTPATMVAMLIPIHTRSHATMVDALARMRPHGPLLPRHR